LDVKLRIKYMKRLILGFSMTLAAFSLVLACAAPPATVPVSLDKPFTLAPGQTAQIQGEALSIRFVGVTADSRCPRNVVCIRAGDVTSEVEVTDAIGTKLLSIVQEASGNGGAKTVFKNIYELTTSVEPYPVSGQTIPPLNYRMNFTVKKL
jgi:hypothetical protein